MEKLQELHRLLAPTEELVAVVASERPEPYVGVMNLPAVHDRSP